MLRTASGIAGAVVLTVAALTPAAPAGAAPQAQTCPDHYGRGQAMIIASTPENTTYIKAKDAGDLVAQLRTADGWQEPEPDTVSFVALRQSRVSAAARSSLYVAIAKSTTNTDLTSTLRENWSRSPHDRQIKVEDSQEDYQGFPSWYLRVRFTGQLDDGTVCCVDEEAQREIAVRTANNSYLVTVHSSTAPTGERCRPLPSQSDFDAGAAQPRDGLTIRAV